MAATGGSRRKGSSSRSGAKRGGSSRSSSKRSSGRARSSSSRSSRSSSSSAATTGLDKSIENFRDSLERSVSISRDRLQEVVDDAVKRGRMQRRDADKMVSDLVSRGRRQTSSLLQHLERVSQQARKEVRGRSGPARRQATQAARRAGRAARDAADRPLAEADRLRRRSGLPARFPITAYDQLTAAQVKSRLGDLTPAELRKVRTYEAKSQNRKGVVKAIDQKLS
jgi:polyhydroxyalkanoate synthesis regulator phasin